MCVCVGVSLRTTQLELRLLFVIAEHAVLSGRVAIVDGDADVCSVECVNFLDD